MKCQDCRNGNRNGSSKFLAKLLKALLERVKGIEPSYSAWKAAALPLSYTRAGDELTRHAGGLNPPPPILSEHPGDTLSAGPGP
jgi:hypothetical protein